MYTSIQNHDKKICQFSEGTRLNMLFSPTLPAKPFLMLSILNNANFEQRQALIILINANAENGNAKQC